MGGSIPGGALALLYFLLFQACGVVIVSCFFKRERFAVRAVLGSAVGSWLLMWLPVLFAFLFDFTVLAHGLAALILLLLTGAAVFFCRPRIMPKTDVLTFLRQEFSLCVPLTLWLIFAGLVLHSFRVVDGEIWSSQCTYGDMSMHFGFITSIAEQQTFPPMYSILPGTELAYPFLSDSISSGLYLLGATLRFAYVLPMFFAGAQVFFGAWIFFRRWLQDKWKAALSMVLFFLNGGFGFAYFLGNLQEDYSNFTRIFTAFYETPTNLVEENIRWVNVIVDMLVPQRATLFGWSILFPLLYILYRAVWERCEAYFLPAAVIAGGMVMIHTHSFLALGLICGVWLLFTLAQESGVFGRMVQHARSTVLILLAVCMGAGLLVPQTFTRESAVWLWLVLLAVAAFAILLIVLLVRAFMRGAGMRLVRTWGVFAAAVLLLAVPQLLKWTFAQASADSFVRGWYNWANVDDGYLWFYVMNLGLAGLLVLPALFSAKRSLFVTAAPAAVIWFICEFVVFQPNNYDNNKLLYAAYLLLCGVVASYMVEVFRALSGGRLARNLLAGICLVLCVLSAVLTIGREAVAEYCLFGYGQRNVAQFVQENTEPEDTVLTDMRHNNEIAALTGRNIVCGSTSYVYFHGLDYYTQQEDIEKMFAQPKQYRALFDEYSVDYVMVSAYEINNYNANEAEIAELFTCVYDSDGIRLYRID